MQNSVSIDIDSSNLTEYGINLFKRYFSSIYDMQLHCYESRGIKYFIKFYGVMTGSFIKLKGFSVESVVPDWDNMTNTIELSVFQGLDKYINDLDKLKSELNHLLINSRYNQ